MHGTFMRHDSGVRPPKSLVARGGLVRTFGGLAVFLAVTFLCSGIYILEDAFANPLEEGAAAVISAAFILTLAAVLLFFLIKPRKGSRTVNSERAAHSVAAKVKPLLDPAAPAARHNNSGKNLGYQRYYVDHSRIRP